MPDRPPDRESPRSYAGPQGPGEGGLLKPQHERRDEIEGVEVGALDTPAEASVLDQRIADARALRVEIEEIFTRAARWNSRERPRGDAVIDPDPGGQLHRLAEQLDRMLASGSDLPD
jgi:hypothetical protein